MKKHPDALPSTSASTLHSPDRCVCMEGDAPERGIYCTGAKPASPSNSIRRRITSNVPLEFSISKDTRDEASFRNGWGMQVSILIIEPLTCFRTARQILTVEKRHASIGLGALTHTTAGTCLHHRRMFRPEEVIVSGLFSCSHPRCQSSILTQTASTRSTGIKFPSICRFDRS